MALCIVHSGVLEPCCAVSTLLCGSHSSGQFTAFLSISEQQLHVSHWFEQLQGQPGEVPWHLGPFSTLSLCQSVPGLGAALTPLAAGALSLTAGRAHCHCTCFLSLLKKLQRNSGGVVVSPENHLCLFMLYC